MLIECLMRYNAEIPFFFLYGGIIGMGCRFCASAWAKYERTCTVRCWTIYQILAL